MRWAPVPPQKGFIGEHYVIFWGAGQLAEMNQGYDVQEYAPGLLLFGSDGGGEAYGFDTRQTPWVIGQVPFVGMAREEFWKMGSSFLEFLVLQRHLARRVSRPAAQTAFSTAPTRLRRAVGRETHRANAQVAL